MSIKRLTGCTGRPPAAWRVRALFLAALALCGVAHAANRTIVDETGRTVILPDDVRRIVSLAPNLTEIVYALNAEDRLAGVTDYCDYPAAARAKPKVGSPVNPSLEAIAALKPDLVLATVSINRLETVESLEHLGIPVYTTNPRSVGDVVDSVQHIADAIGIPGKGADLHAQLERRLETLRDRLRGTTPTRVLFVVWLQPLISIGPHTFLADAVRLAGGESVVQAGQDWPQLSLEAVVRLQPDALIFSTNHTESGAAAAAGASAQSAAAELDVLRGLAVWKDLQAVHSGNVIVVGEEIDRPAPRLIDVIESIAKQLHPDAFAQQQTVPAGGWRRPLHFFAPPDGRPREEILCCPE